MNVLYEDNHLIAVYKKSSEISQSDKTGDISLLEKTKQYFMLGMPTPKKNKTGATGPNKRDMMHGTTFLAVFSCFNLICNII